MRILQALAALVLVSVSAAAHAQEFSASLMSTQRAADGTSSETPVFTIYVKANQMRLEQNQDGVRVVILVDKAAHRVTALRPDLKVAVAVADQKIYRLASLLGPRNPSDACAEWVELERQAANSATPSNCTRIGPETIDGRETIKYQAGTPVATFWVDPKLGFVVRTLSTEGQGLVLRDIHEGNQSPTLFEVPPGYHPLPAPPAQSPG
jgi:hypothetical protein